MLNNFKKMLEEKKEVYLTVKVFPGAGENKIKEILNDEIIKIDIKAQPEKGKANKELTKFLAKEFAVDKANVRIISGAAERKKLIKITR